MDVHDEWEAPSDGSPTLDEYARALQQVIPPPRLVSVFEGAFYRRLANVLAYSARQHCPEWTIDIRPIKLVDLDVSKHAYWSKVIDESPDGARLLLIDCDALILQPLDEVWSWNFDLAYTARDRDVSPWPINAGVVFVRVSDPVRVFFRTWVATVRKMMRASLKDRAAWRASHGSADQKALDDLLHNSVGRALHRLELSCRVWNCEDSEWARFGPETRILHVKGALRNSLCDKYVSEKRRAAVEPLTALWKATERAMKADAPVPTIDAPTAVAAVWTPIDEAHLPTIALSMRTADRHPKQNYVGGTIRRMLAQGVDPASIHLCATAPEIGWLKRELREIQVTLHVPTRRLTANENGLEQIRVIDPTSAEWLLLLEDDLAFCTDFYRSAQRWIAKHARPDRHVYRFFGTRLHPPARGSAYDVSLKSMGASQAVLLRMADARDFLAWSEANLEAWGRKRGSKAIAFDKLIGSWAEARWGHQPGLMSRPLFVQHIGDASSLHARGVRNDAHFAGLTWTYREASA